MRKNSIKNRRINDEVQRALSGIIRDVKDPRISPLTSVMDVEVAPDLKTCKIWISVFTSGTGEEKAAAVKETMEGLKSASGFIRGKLARRVNLRNTPVLQFLADTSIAYGVEMSHQIDEVIAKDYESASARGDEEPGGAPEA